VVLSRLPTEPGPITELFDRLHELHLRAGQPSLRTMVQGIEGGPSRGTIANVFKGPGVGRWEYIEKIVDLLGGDVSWFHELWVRAQDAEDRRPSRQAPDGVPPIGNDLGVAARRYPFVMVSYGLPTEERVSPVAWQRRVVGPSSVLGELLRGREGVWVGTHGTASIRSGSTIRNMKLEQIPLTGEDITRHYEGFSNSSIWPLYHYSVVRPEFRPEWDESNRIVNRRFAEAVIRTAEPGAMVWIHDYQLQLLPAMVREQRPDLRIGFFLHIPFPAPEVFEQLPARSEILRGFLGADLVGFQLPLSVENFLRAVRTLPGVTTNGSIVTADDRRVAVDSFPISVDAEEIERLAASPRTVRRARRIRAEFGDPRTIVLSIDRLDYTKGIEERLNAYGGLLESGAVRSEDTVFVQLGTPSRERIGAYVDLGARIDRMAGRLSAQHPRRGGSAVQYQTDEWAFDEILARYTAADVMVVTPLRGGMNLVAKEFVASRIDNRGVLILSEFAGAAAELRDGALVVNTNDQTALKNAILEAISMSTEDQERRMDAMRRRVRHHDVVAWAVAFTQRLARRPDPRQAVRRAAREVGQ
jgi:trehalose 6-phosphate synthase